MPALNSVDGIASGLNTTTIVDAIMKAESQPIDLLAATQKEKTDIISSLKALQARMLALQTELKKLSRASTFEAAKIQVSDDTILKATSAGRVGVGSYALQVLSLAKNHQIASKGFADSTSNVFGTGSITLQFGGGSAKTINIESGNNSLTGIKNAINSAKVGVTATIVDDGSSSNRFRLLLTGDKTGLKNKISFSTSLTGGQNLTFSGASFDAPERISLNPASTSAFSIGTTASNSGSQNKTFTFTVGGTGSQTIGSNVISIDWSDGTNSGTVVVTQADTEVDLVGTGADGLKLSFGAGTLNAGDTFQVQSFSSLVQQAADAKIAYGGAGSSGSPITVASETNTFANVAPGMTINVQKTTIPGESVTISADRDYDAIRKSINDVITRYNDVQDYIRAEGSYDLETKTSGRLSGDITLRMIQSTLSSALGSAVKGLTGKYTNLAAVGIRTGATGKLSLTSASKLDGALKDNLDEVIKLFTDSASASNSAMELVSAGTKVKTGESFDVNITQAATRGTYEGASIADPSVTPLTLTSSANRLKLTVDGATSDEIILDAATYSSTSGLVDAIQAKINADSKIGTRGIKVEWVPGAVNAGRIRISSASYGSNSKVELVTSISNSGFTVLGLSAGTSYAGKDVAGTIAGEAAEGKGQTLTSKKANKLTPELAIKVILDENQILSNAIEGKITVTRGVATRIQNLVDSLSRSADGTIDRRVKGYQSQVDDIQGRIEDYTKRLALRREALFQKFYDMEQAIGQLNSQGNFLSNQLAAVANNYGVKKN
jgi:flagellar hook-associated protein 2